MFGKFTEIESNRETFHLNEMSQSLVFNDLNFIHVVFKSGKKMVKPVDVTVVLLCCLHRFSFVYTANCERQVDYESNNM